MTLLLYHTFVFIALFSYGLYHLALSTISFFKFPHHLPLPYHPLPSHNLRQLPLYLIISSLLLSIILHFFISSSLSSLIPPLSLFLLLSLSLLLFPLPSSLTFLLSSLSFSLLSLPSYPSSLDLQSKTHSLSSFISLSSALFSLILSIFPKLFIFEFALSLSISVQGVWSLLSGLTLYVERFVPEGCHRLIDVGEAITRCDVEESRIRAGQVLDLVFEVGVVGVVVVGVVVFVVVGRVWGGGLGGLGRRANGGSYEALATSSLVGGLSDMEGNVQMKVVGKSDVAQA